MPWSLLFNKWVLIGLLIAALAAFGQYERWQANRWQAIAEAERERVKALSVEISAQNAAVDALKAEGDRKMEAAEKGLASVQDRVTTLQDQAARLSQAAKQAAQAPSSCPALKAAVEEIRKGLDK